MRSFIRPLLSFLRLSCNAYMIFLFVCYFRCRNELHGLSASDEFCVLDVHTCNPCSVCVCPSASAGRDYIFWLYAFKALILSLNSTYSFYWLFDNNCGRSNIVFYLSWYLHFTYCTCIRALDNISHKPFRVKFFECDSLSTHLKSTSNSPKEQSHRNKWILNNPADTRALFVRFLFLDKR